MNGSMKPVLVVIVGAALWACKVPNLDHCYHQSAKPNLWCIENHPSQPYCSPCEQADGCVAIEPSLEDCPDYIPGTGEPTDTESGTESETETVTDSDPTDSGSSTGDSSSGTT